MYYLYLTILLLSAHCATSSDSCHQFWFCDECIAEDCLWCESDDGEMITGKCRDPLTGGCSGDMYMDECPAHRGGDRYIEWDYYGYPGLDFESQRFTSAYESDLHVYSFGENSCLNASLQGVDRGVFLTSADERWNVAQDGIVYEPPFMVALSDDNDAEQYTFELSSDDTGGEIVVAIPSDRIDVCDAVLVVSIRNAVLCAEQSDCESCIRGEVGGCQWCASSCIPIQDDCEAPPVDECDLLLLEEDDAAASSTDVGIIAIIVGSLVGTCACGAYAHGRIKQNRRYHNKPAKSPNARVPGRWR